MLATPGGVVSAPDTQTCCWEEELPPAAQVELKSKLLGVEDPVHCGVVKRLNLAVVLLVHESVANRPEPTSRQPMLLKTF